MPAAPFPVNEIKRLVAVQKVRLFGTPAEERFDKITRHARRMFDVPLAIIDIVGEKMAWLKSVQGSDVDFEAPRALSYCHYTVLKDEVCLIPDARNDPRVSDNPYASTFIFYAGVPLKFDGHDVGVLCIAANEQRTMTEEQLDALRDLASLAEHELEVGALSESQLRLAASNEELRMKARVDVLTRVWNRGAIHEIAACELEDGHCRGASTGIARLDIDHFKLVNDTYGHAAGDEGLRVISRRLRAAMRPTDAVGRYGGEEFLLVLPNVTSDSLPLACERIRRAISSEPATLEGGPIGVTCSMGYALAQGGTELLDTLVQSADSGLFKAKRSGGDRVNAA